MNWRAAPPDWALRVLAAFLVVGTWAWLSTRVSPALLPSPGATWDVGWEMVTDGTLGTAWKESAVQILFGMVIASTLGVSLAIVVGWYQAVDRVTSPVVTILFLTPRIAFVPLLAIWLGYDDLAKIALIVLFSFFEIFLTVKRGVQAVEDSYIELSRSYSIPDRDLLRKVIFPAVTPYVAAGLRLGLLASLVGVVLAGFFFQVNGIGGLIYQAGSTFRTAELLVAVGSLSVVALTISTGLRRLEAVLMPWRAEVTR
ncbi:ABC transporter permease [Conexibacter woesei]|uniref:Binding-protein-dependent transport systems inner membrane component n=1 Tax=Conexibacter woesei (strain DSM 14684 / CCUG 47730 / CIP 108061 / JCM 11494 / NBRC 100937 / ID131577) TaxID=469383 RepID=D3F7J3_CONWI|nr:ABC transporter permease [Conexibacter woesei]ADB50855.1 binding-protein-dependent transport systems inner membrane component [Conexibacter woesei DSM 14684]